MAPSIEKMIQDKIVTEALKKIDLNAIATRLAPKVQQSLENNLLRAIGNLDLEDILADDLYDAISNAGFPEILSGALRKGLGLPPLPTPLKKKRR